MFFFRWLLLLISLIISLLGCSAVNLQEFSLETPAQILHPVGMPPVKDGRAHFREIFCKLLSEVAEYQDKARNCENYLTRLSDERMPAEQFRQLPANNVNLRILIIPGFLGECIADTAFPFESAMEHLRPQGYQIEPLIVSGYDMLKTIDPRNDGLLLFSDQVIPGSILLGYVNDDHWEVALPLEDNDSMLSKSISKQKSYPREILLHAIILFVAENLNSSGSPD